MRIGSRWRLSLLGKLVAMMFGMLVLILATLFALYWRAESQLIDQVERHTSDLSTAIQISVEQITSKGRSSEARLQDYMQRLQQRGVREISIVSNEEEVIASSNPRRVGARVDPKRKDITPTGSDGSERTLNADDLGGIVANAATAAVAAMTPALVEAVSKQATEAVLNAMRVQGIRTPALAPAPTVPVTNAATENPLNGISDIATKQATAMQIAADLEKAGGANVAALSRVLGVGVV